MPVEAILWSICVVLLPYCNFFSNTLGVPFLVRLLLKVPQNWGQTKCIQSSKREKYFYFSWRPLFSWFDLTEHDWLPIESLFRFIVFAHSVDRMLVAGLKIMCLLLSVIHFGCWCSTGCIICSLCNILNVCRIKLYIKGGKVRKTTTLKSNFLGGCSSCYNNLV